MSRGSRGRKRRDLRAASVTGQKAVMTKPTWIENADAGAIAEQIAQRLVAPGARRIAVPGGKTPVPILARLAALPVPWERLTIGLTDDRDVPEDHEASNFGALRRAMEPTGVALERMIVGPVAKWNLVWVGMGEDGHIASIFPQPGLDETLPPCVVRLVPDPLPPEAPFARLTQSYAALAATDALMLVANGAGKRRVLEAAIAGGGARDLPIARLLRRVHAPITIYWSA